MTLIDDSGAQISVTLWGAAALTPDIEAGRVAAFRGVKVSDFGGRSLNCGEDC